MENVEDEIIARILTFKLDFMDAKKYLLRAKSEKDHFIRDGLIKIAIVTYAKAFLKSNGVHKPVKKFCLFKEEIVPEKYYWLHERFMNYRGNFIGHSNFNSMKPEVPIEPEERDGMVNIVNHIGINYDHWFEIDGEFIEQPLIVDQAIDLVSTISNSLPGDGIEISKQIIQAL